jgi:hypothetical protein
MKNNQAQRKAIVLLTAGLALAAQSQSGPLPTVYRATATVYASVTYPGQMAFAADGTMYVANGDNSGPVKIYRVAPGGTPVESFGRTAILDPDSVAVDRTGAISGMPGAVLVGGPGFIKGISPTGLVFDLFTGLTSFPNINSFTFDRSGRLLAMDATGNWGVVTASAVTKLGSVSTSAGDIAADAANRVWISAYADSRIRIFSSAGSFLDYATVGATAPSCLASSASQFWGTNIYAIGSNGNLLNIDLAGNVKVMGSGFQDAADQAYLGVEVIRANHEVETSAAAADQAIPSRCEVHTIRHAVPTH